jgi:FkbM family methyltransferase
MKNFLRTLSQRLGLYETLGVWAARLAGWRRHVRITQTADRDFCLQDRDGKKIFLHQRHSIYLLEFVHYFDFYFDGVIPNDRNEVHYEKPAWHTPRRWNQPLYFTSFAESAEVMDLYLEHGRIKPGDVVLDLGAYCGLTALGFAAKVGSKGHVYAFEPDPGNFAALQTNLETYAVTNVTAEPCAIWKESGFIHLQAEGTVSSMVLSLAPRTHSTVQVKAITLSDYLREKDIQRLDLIKIDVEGAEVEILASSRQTLRDYRPRLIIEVHLVHEVMTTAACQALLREIGYQTREIPQPGTASPLLIGEPGN